MTDRIDEIEARARVQDKAIEFGFSAATGLRAARKLSADRAYLLSAIRALQAEVGEMREAFDNVSRFTPEMAENLANWIDKKSPHDVAQGSLRRLAENLRSAHAILTPTPGGTDS